MKFKNLCLVCFCSFSFLLVHAEVTTSNHAIFFDTSKDSPNEVSDLTSTIKNQLKTEDFEIFLDGFADPRGSIEYNKDLSKRRALKVKEILIKSGFDPQKIRVAFFGEDNPYIQNEYRNNLEYARRVDITINQYSYRRLEDIWNIFNEENLNSFHISKGQGASVTCRNGLKLSIPKDALIDQNGSVVSNYELEVLEALDYATYMASNLQTRSDDQLLVSGGMFKIDAFDKDGNPLKLKPGTDLTAYLPSDKLQDGMKVYTSETGSNWNTDGDKVSAEPTIRDKIIEMRDNIELPVPPIFKASDKKVDNSKFNFQRPSKPSKKREPKIPHTPRKESFIREISFWDALFGQAGKIKAKQQSQYNQAMNEYAKKIGKYDDKYENYETSLLKFEKDSLQYVEDLNFYNDSFASFKKHEEAKISERDKGEWEAYLQEKKVWKEKCRAMEDELVASLDNMDIGNISDVPSYLLQPSNMGWINIDKLYPQDAQLMSLKINAVDETSKSVFVVFEDINSMLAPSTKDGKTYEISRLPKNEKMKVISIKMIKGVPMIAIQKVNPNQPNLRLNYKKSSFAEIRTQLKEFG